MLLDIIEGLPLLIPNIYFCYMIIHLVYDEQQRRMSYILHLKYMFCLGATITLFVSVMIVMTLHIYQVATIWHEYELTHDANISLVKSASFTSIEIIWSVIFVVLSWQIFKNIYYKQIISGEGSLKKRILFYWNNFKKSTKKKEVVN